MNFLTDLWRSFCSMPLWVRFWIVLILIPVNFAALAFIGEPASMAIAILAVAGIAFNIIPLWINRGFTNAMAIPHVIFWVPLIFILIFQLLVSETAPSNEYRTFLLLLLACDVFSLIFDIPDSIKALRDRKA